MKRPDKSVILEDLQKLCLENGGALLYASYYGSDLFGTATENSDTDVKGIYLPSFKSLALGRVEKSLHRNTKTGEGKNRPDDVDMELWSLQYWLLELLEKGDTGASDLLFSPSNKDCVIYQSPLMAEIFANPEKVLNANGNKNYIRYSLGQAKKYGIKGSRLGALKKLIEWLDKNKFEEEDKLGLYLKAILENCGDGRYCVEANCDKAPALQVCGKTHMSGISMREFKERMALDFARYGKRAEMAERNAGVDFKSLSHAVRAIDQVIELMENGKISYPLKTAPDLLKIKRGELSYQEVEKIILNKLESIKDFKENAVSKRDKAWIEDKILAMYE